MIFQQTAKSAFGRVFANGAKNMQRRGLMHGASEAPKYTRRWWIDHSVIMLVFAITGSSTMQFVRPTLSYFDITGSWKEGPWSYRLAYTGLTLPLYSTILITTGFLFGRPQYFSRIVWRMYSRLMPQSVRNSVVTRFPHLKSQ